MIYLLIYTLRDEVLRAYTDEDRARKLAKWLSQRWKTGSVYTPYIVIPMKLK